ncbi:MAG: hypothetical protein JNM28_09515 [Armatimonadetes bacterium]|nr:hypothetical protein [Armatimonadota bacterium]MBS1710702.1 hypothetical protein [Armatimonadota bacterium]MBX3108373.1 hypothetical protein [Fimbriimonadaceae bacterium]
MLALYVVTGVVGLGLIILSALGALGGSDVDHDAHFEIGGHHEFDASPEAPHGIDHDHGLDHGGSDFWLPFFSLRFWTYLLGGFGGFGILLTVIGLNQEPLRVVASSCVGLVSGLGAAIAMRYFQTHRMDSSISEKDYLGASARVTVAPSPGSPGKVRLVVKDETIDMLALPLEGQAIAAGDQVVVVSVDGTVVTVANADQYMDS